MNYVRIYGAAHYDTVSKKIRMNYAYDAHNARGPGATWFHEHGHLIDDIAGRISTNIDFKDLLDSDFIDYLSKYGKESGYKTLDKIEEAISKELANMREHSAVSDLLNCLSGGSINGVAKHDSEYWMEASDRITSEAFAHMFEAQFDVIRHKQMEKYFPKSLQKFESMLGGIIG